MSFRDMGKPTAPPDLLGLLQAAWLDGRQIMEEHQQVVQDFIDFSREILRQNQPVGMDYLGTSLALRLQDGSVVGIVDGGGQEMPEQPPSFDISQNLQQQGGRGATVQSPAWGITGTRQ